ncbi:hypothetical protein [Mesorhizobium sp.]|uniref:hypothetical protein n=1 Tax=Mesorhizobium sp. TaxID=1871066 RepID=UPI000FE41CA7|nr:hypothetical protein [Mesorhizobium sp.]RWN98532.1 MAG: hypothetical protein EOS06_23800 [Mesorhizobium sp.]RWO21970.1 MAG: hypothetical protein EOS09_21825 [Mesorhizobium sp.]
MGAIDEMVSALSGIYLSSCGIIGSIFGKIGQVHHGLTELNYAFGRDMAARPDPYGSYGGWLTYICARFMSGGR